MTNALLKSRLENLKDSGFFKNLIIKRGITARASYTHI